MNYAKAADMFRKRTVFCFTSDTEWSPEWAIQFHHDFFDSHGIPVQYFLTHKSPFLLSKYHRMPTKMGWHPNFLPQSSHGTSPSEVLSTCKEFWPQGRSYRSHYFFGTTDIDFQCKNFGAHYDSNLLLYLQPYISPLRLSSNIPRFPVWWEDDIHWKHGTWDFESFAPQLRTPGLKVLNVHPLTLFLNARGAVDYAERKFLYKESNEEIAKKYVLNGDGLLTFMESWAKFIKRENLEVCFLDDIFEELECATD